MLSQLKNPISLVNPKGKAWAVAIIDYGPQWDLLWVTFIQDSGECWTFNNTEISQERVASYGIDLPATPPAWHSHKPGFSRMQDSTRPEPHMRSPNLSRLS